MVGSEIVTQKNEDKGGDTVCNFYFSASFYDGVDETEDTEEAQSEEGAIMA